MTPDELQAMLKEFLLSCLPLEPGREEYLLLLNIASFLDQPSAAIVHRVIGVPLPCTQPLAS